MTGVLAWALPIIVGSGPPHTAAAPVAAGAAGFKKCHFQVTPENEMDLIVRGVLFFCVFLTLTSPRIARNETTMGRFKGVIGDGLRSRTDQRPATEVEAAVHVLNRMLELGRPKSVRIA